MKHMLWKALAVTALVGGWHVSALAGSTAPVEDGLKEAVLDLLGDVGHHFEENAGHLPADVPFSFRADEYRIDLKAGGLAVVPNGADQVLGSGLSIDFLESRRGATPQGIDELSFRTMQPKRSGRQLVSVTTYNEVRFLDLYDGIALRYHANSNKLEYDFEVAPGKDPSQIALGIGQSDDVRIDKEGNLQISHASGQAIHHKPFIYQMIDGSQVEVGGSYQLVDDHTVQFDIDVYDASKPLIIDPVITINLDIMR